MSVAVAAKTTVDSGPLERMIARLSPPSIAAVIEHFAQLIAARARELSPKETLGLEESIRALLEGMSAKIVAGEGLPDIRAIAQELGFHHHGSGTFVQNAYLLPAMEEYRQPFVAAIAALVRG